MLVNQQPLTGLARARAGASAFKHLAARYIVPARAPNGGLRLAFDVEADALLDKATKVHCIVATDLDNDQTYSYGPGQIADALAHLARVDCLVGHNICGYDLPLLRRLYNWAPSAKCVVADTLIASRVILPNLDELDDQAAAMGDPPLGKLRGRYSLEAWGARLGIPKTGADITDWSDWTPEVQERCAGDVRLTKALWRFLQPDGQPQTALALEHRVATICNTITAAGIPFDTKAAEQPREQWTERRAALEARLRAQFREIKNWNSRQQIAALLESRGWTPGKRTAKTGQPAIDDELLETLPQLYPEFDGLAEHYILGRRLGQLADGKQAWLSSVGSDGRIHGGIIHIGTPHGRAKHLQPNLAQVPNPKRGKPLAAECRALFRTGNDWMFVTCDQAGLQDRAFAHYLAAFDGGDYAKAYAAGLDPHWAAVRALGLVPAATARDKDNKLHTALREGAKAFRYGFLFGMGSARAGTILHHTIKRAQQADPTCALMQRFFGTAAHPGAAVLKRVGAEALDKFIDATPGLSRLRKSLEAQARCGWLPGLDDRRVPVRAQYTTLNYAVTSAEAVICKRWLVNVHDALHARFRFGWDGDAVIVAWVHDELVVCCRPAIADEVGAIMVRFAVEAGEHYDLRLPLAADYVVGRSWAGEAIDNKSTDAKASATVESPKSGKFSPLPSTPTPTPSPMSTSPSMPTSPPSPTPPHTLAGDGGSDSDDRLPWATPTVTEVAPSSAEFDAIGASLNAKDRAVVRPPEAPRGNGAGAPPGPEPSAKSNGNGRADHKILCPFHDDHTPSLQIYPDENDPHYHCFACGAHGPLDELPIDWSGPASHAGGQADDADTLARAHKLWDESKPIAGTLAARYLTNRHVDVDALPTDNAALRFHPQCPFGSGTRHPCLVALFRDVESDAPAGIHRIALTADAQKIERRMLGRWPSPRAVKLWPAASALVIGEGIETVLAAATRITHHGAPLRPAWATGSAGGIARFPVMASVERLTVLVDNDAVGRDNARACARQWFAAGRTVLLLTPRQPDADFNDVVRECVQ